MDRLSTLSTYNSALLGIYSAQSREQAATTQISSQHKASDIKGYADQAEALTATQTVKARLDAYATTGAVIADKLSGQDTALTALESAASGVGKSVLNAIATGGGAALSSQLQGYFGQAVDALNTNYQGQYLFSGGEPGTAPVSTSTLSDLATTTVAAVFQNGDQKTVSRLDDNISLTTGVLASDIGTPLFTALKSIADYVGTNGDFTTPLTSAQTSFLQTTLASLNTATTGVTSAVTANGVVQQRVADTQTQITDQQNAAGKVISDITSTDVAQTDSDLQLAQLALQASAQVLSSLKSASLLNTLTTTG